MQGKAINNAPLGQYRTGEARVHVDALMMLTEGFDGRHNLFTGLFCDLIGKIQAARYSCCRHAGCNCHVMKGRGWPFQVRFIPVGYLLRLAIEFLPLVQTRQPSL
jgi:hypothetical protein